MDNLQVVRATAPATLREGKSKISRKQKKMKIHKNHLKTKAIKPQFGLVAEEVEQVNPDLVIHDKDGKIYSVRYEAINAMLLNEFLKEHKKVEKLEATLEAVNARLQEQATQIQKLTAQVDATKPLPHWVLNNP